MADILVSWSPDPAPAVASYSVFFTVTPPGSTTPNQTLTLSVPRSAASDASGYTTNYSALSPTPPALANGDSVVVTAESIDTFGQKSPMIVANGSPVAIVIVPPAPTGPVNLTAKQV